MGDVRLSAAGESRREVMLRELQSEVRAAPLRRARGRAAVAGACAVVMLVGAVWTAVRAPVGTVGQRVAMERAEPGEAGAVGIERVTTAGLMAGMDGTGIERVRTDGGIVAALRIGDVELLTALREAGHPAGLARIGGPGGRVIVTGLAMDDRGRPGGG